MLLSACDKRKIFKAHNAGLYTYQELADNYGVSKDTIYRALKSERAAEANAATVRTVVPKVEVSQPKPEIVWNASSKFISITAGRESFNATPSTHQNFQEILEKLVAGELETALDMINIEKAVTRYVDGDIVIDGGRLVYQGIELRSGLVDRILDSMNKGENFKFYLPFLENLLENPSTKAVSRLFDFLVANDIEITEDGHFIGWKVVRDTYMDCYTGTMDNSVGKTVKMPRTRVNDNDEVTCSQGLHVCSKGYIGHFGSGNSRVVAVKVHPRDVVSIPVDYSDAKMRTCQYTVLADVTHQFTNELRGSTI